MKKFVILFILIIPALQGCSVTKDIPARNIEVTPQSAPNLTKDVSDKTRRELLFLARSSDLKYIETKLKDFSHEEINFQDSNQGSEVLALLLEMNDIKKLQLFLKAGLSIYHKESQKVLNMIHLDEQRQALDYLNRFNPRNKIDAQKSDSLKEGELLLAKLHSDFISKIEGHLLIEKIYEPKVWAEESLISCKDLTFSLVLRSITQEQRKYSGQIEKLLAGLNCAKSLSAEETNLLYQIEIKKLFQDKFLETSIIKYLSESQPLGDSMVLLGESGIRLSPWKLYEISKTCTFDPKNTGKNPEGYESIAHCSSNQYTNQCDHDTKEIRDNCISKFQLPITLFDFTYTQENLRIASIQHLVIGNGEFSGIFPAQVTDYMYGFSDNEKKWKMSLDYELSKDPLGDM